MNQNKILVTGGSGMVGRHLADIMPDAFYADRSHADLRDYGQTVHLFSEVQPDVVVHLAAHVGGLASNLATPAEYFDDNILINTNVMRAAKRFVCGRFIGILSTCAYPDTISALGMDQYPMTEDMLHLGPPPESAFAFAMTKRALATQIDAYNKQYETQYSYLIPCNMYSEYDNFDPSHSHFAAALIRKIYEAKRWEAVHIELMGTGAPIRQFMYAGDLAWVIKQCIEKNITECMNVSIAHKLTISQMALIALNACDAKNIAITFDKTKPDGQYRKDVSAKRLRMVLPKFDPTPFYDGIKRAYKGYEKLQQSKS